MCCSIPALSCLVQIQTSLIAKPPSNWLWILANWPVTWSIFQFDQDSEYSCLSFLLGYLLGETKAKTAIH